MAYWQVYPGDPIQVECRFDAHCLFCPGVRLVPKNLSPIFFPVYSDGKTSTGHAFDIKLNCPECGSSELFGVAVSEKEWSDLVEKKREVGKN